MKLALSLPFFGQIENPPNLKFSGATGNLASVVSDLLTIAFYVAGFLAFYYLVWGAFAYLMAQGNKENLAKARAKISFALIGLIIILMAYFIAQYAGEIFTPQKGLPF